jgi:hypothetical protein
VNDCCSQHEVVSWKCHHQADVQDDNFVVINKKMVGTYTHFEPLSVICKCPILASDFSKVMMTMIAMMINMIQYLLRISKKVLVHARPDRARLPFTSMRISNNSK